MATKEELEICQKACDEGRREYEMMKSSERADRKRHRAEDARKLGLRVVDGGKR